ncbi:hypothetical protein [Caudoviricetes sp.]|nr:hypothetical protein [Caudoviricetes sp.]UOF81125.1 hypothetical protein [Caudoviricetes sp.]UOF82239.1 hypothetical protein [Caudoviricetes sp.]UOF82470.1 hypothetical protein [Caudoviricetes sp.]UOF82624.1 hypothetical protein [Caudoviricetes sp.]
MESAIVGLVVVGVVSACGWMCLEVARVRMAREWWRLRLRLARAERRDREEDKEKKE